MELMQHLQVLVIGVYALLLLIGGFIGHTVAGSWGSLIAGGISALVLSICAALVWKKNNIAYVVATVVVAFLAAFFGYRFFLTGKWMPGGMMTIVSAAVFIYLYFRMPKK